MEALTSLIITLALMILLAATSVRFGVDSRDGYTTKESELARRGIT